MMMLNPIKTRKAFTLIELSIVLVIIGVIVGGILTGRDLIAAAAVRAQISQMEQYQQAVNTFRSKFNALPGDIKDPDASMFGFVPRGTAPGQGDGNGVLASNLGGYFLSGAAENGGEVFGLWKDLGDAHLIDYQSGLSDMTNAYVTLTTATIGKFLPTARVGRGNYIYVYSSGGWNGSVYSFTGTNYFGLSVYVNNNNPGWLSSNPGLSVSQAASIDRKADDGLPQSGNITAAYLNITSNGYSASYGGPGLVGTSDTSATPGTSTTCYDNNNLSGATQQYSMTQNNGAGMNCALSFKFK